jgi:hypothetical protein
VSYLQAFAAAPLITARLSSPGALRAGDSLSLLGDLDQYEASWLKIVDSSGATLRVSGYDAPTGIGAGASNGALQSDGVPLGPVSIP